MTVTVTVTVTATATATETETVTAIETGATETAGATRALFPEIVGVGGRPHGLIREGVAVDARLLLSVRIRAWTSKQGLRKPCLLRPQQRLPQPPQKTRRRSGGPSWLRGGRHSSSRFRRRLRRRPRRPPPTTRRRSGVPSWPRGGRRNSNRRQQPPRPRPRPRPRLLRPWHGPTSSTWTTTMINGRQSFRQRGGASSRII